MRRFVKLSLRDKMVKHGVRIHNKEISSRTPLDVSERTMKSLLAQWVNAWCKETRRAQQIVMSPKWVLREVPIADSLDAILEPLGVILLRPPQQNAPATLFNNHVIEQPMKLVIMNQNRRPSGPPAPQRAPLASLPSRSERRAR